MNFEELLLFYEKLMNGLIIINPNSEALKIVIKKINELTKDM